MRHIFVIAFACMVFAMCGCSSGTAPEQPQKIPSFTLSPSEKEALVVYCKDLLSAEGLADNAVKLAENEVMKLSKAVGGLLL